MFDLTKYLKFLHEQADQYFNKVSEGNRMLDQDSYSRLQESASHIIEIEKLILLKEIASNLKDIRNQYVGD